MPITNFEFPGVTLRQVYDETPVGTVRTLGVACVGTVYSTHNANNSDEALKVNGFKYTADTTVDPLGGHVQGGKLDETAASQHLVVKNGVYAYAVDAAITAAMLNTTKGTIAFGYDVAGQGMDATKFGTRGLLVGDPIVLVGTTKTVVATVISIAKDDSTVTVGAAALAEALGAGTTLTKVLFCEYADARYDGASGVFTIAETEDSNQVHVSYALTIYSTVDTTDLGDSGLTLELTDWGDTPRGASLIDGDVYIEYRESLTSYTGKRGSVGTLQDVQAVLGTPCADNPLAMACYAAVAAGNNSVVYFTGVDNEDVADYVEALDFLAKYDDIYSIVPTTDDADIIRACLTSCKTFSEDAESTIRRGLWYGIDVTDEGASKEDKVQDLVTQRTDRSADMRGVCVWADHIQYNGETLPNYIGAASAAGMRAYEPCQRPLSNLGYSLFTVKEDTGFTKSQLKELGANGIWIIANNTDGLPVNLRQITTAVSNNLNKDEESIVANVDAVAMAMSQIGRNLVGCSNITAELLLELQNSLVHLFDSYLINTTGSPYIGAQLLAYEIVSVYQDPVNLDHVYANVTITPPKPFNRFNMTVRVI